MTEKRKVQVSGLSKLWENYKYLDRSNYVKILPIYPYDESYDGSVNDNNYKQSGVDWYIDSKDSLTTYFIKDLDQNVLTCVKCNDTSTKLEPCNNCGSKEFDSRFRCVKCLQIHQQSRWICKHCNCDNPIQNTLTHWVEIEATVKKKKKKGVLLRLFVMGILTQERLLYYGTLETRSFYVHFWEKSLLRYITYYHPLLLH